MAYQSEAQLEEQLIEQLKNQNYSVVSLPDYDALLANFKEQFEAFNAVYKCQVKYPQFCSFNYPQFVKV